MSDSLWSHGLQHARLPCLSLSPGISSNLCPLGQWCYITMTFSPSPFPAFNLSQHQIFFFPSESALHIKLPKYCSFSFSISPSNEYSGLISFRIDWFDLLAVHGTLKSLLQQHSSKTLILWCSAFFIDELSYPLCDYWKKHSFYCVDISKCCLCFLIHCLDLS